METGMKKTIRKIASIAVTAAMAAALIPTNSAFAALTDPLTKSVTPINFSNTNEYNTSDACKLAKMYTLGINASGAYISNQDYQSLTGAQDWGAIRGKKLIFDLDGLREELKEDAEFISKITMKVTNGIFSDIPVANQVKSIPDTQWYTTTQNTAKETVYSPLDDKIIVGYTDTNLYTDTNGKTVSFADTQYVKDGANTVQAAKETVLYHIEEDGSNTIAVAKPLGESVYEIADEELEKRKDAMSNLNNIEFSFDLTASLKEALAGTDSLKAYSFWLSNETRYMSVRNWKTTVTFDFITQEQFLANAKTSENTESYVLRVLTTKANKEAYEALSDAEKATVHSVVKNAEFSSMSDFQKVVKNTVNNVAGMSEDNMSTMEEVLVPAYMDKFISDTDEYKEFITLSAAGQKYVRSYINTNKASLTGSADLAAMTEDGAEAYFTSADLEADDTDTVLSHFEINDEVWTSMTAGGKNIVRKAFAAADRSSLTSADAASEILSDAIAVYYAGDVADSDVQLTITTSNGQSLIGNSDASIDGVSGGISLSFKNASLALENVKLYKGTEEITLTENNGKLVPADGSILAETEYKLTWEDLADGVYDSSISFTTTGLYTQLYAALAKDTAKEQETIAYTGAQAVFSSGAEKSLTPNVMNITVEDTSVVKYENAKFTALKRGITPVKFEKTNEGGADPVTDGRIISVYSKQQKGTLSSTMKRISANYDVDVFSTSFTTDGSGSFKLTVGDKEFTVTVARKGEHQAVIEAKDGKLTLYVDGVKAEQQTAAADKFNAVTASDFGSTTFSDTCLMDVYGTVCYAEDVKIIAIGTDLKASYTYKDADSDDKTAEAGSVYEWYANGDKIDGENSLTLDASSYAGKTIVFKVTPKNAHDIGAVYASEGYTMPKSNGGGGNSGNGSSGGRGSNTVSGGTDNSFIVSYPSAREEAKDDAPKAAFTDVSKESWAYESIAALVEKKILSGYDDGSFKPDNKVTRAEFVCALVNVLGIDKPGYNGGFTDVSEGDWHAAYVAAAVSSGIINGFDDGSFGPDELITREQLAVIISKAFSLTEAAELNFADNAEISTWAYDGVAKTCAAGIMQGRDGNCFAPQATATRAEMAAILARVTDR